MSKTVNGLTQYGVYIECLPDQQYNSTQIIQKWPFGIDSNYFKTVKPRGYFR